MRDPINARGAVWTRTEPQRPRLRPQLVQSGAGTVRQRPNSRNGAGASPSLGTRSSSTPRGAHAVGSGPARPASLPRRGPRAASNPWLTLGRMTLRGEKRPAHDPRGVSRRACPFVALRLPPGLPRRLPRRIRGARYCDDGRVRLREEAERPSGHREDAHKRLYGQPRCRRLWELQLPRPPWGDQKAVAPPKTQTSYTWTGLRPGVPYYFWVATRRRKREQAHERPSR